MLLNGQVSIVTGAGRGIGKSIALSLARAGATVVICSRTEKEIKAVQSELEVEEQRVYPFKCDVTQSIEIEKMVSFTIKNFGNIDIVINNAGQLLKKPIVPFPEKYYQTNLFKEPIRSPMSDEEWKNVFSVNLDSVFYCCRSVIPAMLERKKGTIINISSTSGVQAHPFYSAYNASKAAVNMFTRVMALELADFGIRVNAISPGQFHTPMTDFLWTDKTERQKRLNNIPLHKEGDTKDIGHLAVYLCSDSAKYITGQIIHVDGGISAR